MKSFSPFKYIYTIGDLALLNLSITIAAILKFNNGIQYHAEQYPTLFVLFNILWLLLIAIFKPYEYKRTGKVSKRIQQIILLIIVHALLISGFWVMTKAYYYSREFLLITYVIFVFSSILFHLFLSYLEHAYRLSGKFQKKIIILGYGELANELEIFFRGHPEFGYNFNGYFDNTHTSSKIIGRITESFGYIKANKIEDVYCCIPYLDSGDIKKMIDFGDENFIKIKLIADYSAFSSKSLELQRYDHIPILNITNVPLDSWENRFLKRTFDIIFSILVLVLIFSWLYPIIALLIKISSKGPVFFKQDRTGKGNDDFACYKFRTMRINGESDTKQATEGDSRITKIGAFLRKTSLDEFPQFINVFLGDMSVIGPRPHPMNLNKQFELKIEKFMARHFVKPGITGLAQAKGYRGPTLKLFQMKNRIKLDLFYIENWSLWLDIKIIALTIISIIKGDENAF